MAGTQIANGQAVLRPQIAGRRSSRSLLEIEAWLPSEIKTISPLVNRLMRLIEGSRCVTGSEPAVELALREALSNAVVHGNGMDAHKLVQIRCRCELGKGVLIIVKDHGQGFDPRAVPDPLAVERLEAEHGRGIHLMKLAMDEVSFERGGTEVHMRKGLARNPSTELRSKNETASHRFENSSEPDECGDAQLQTRRMQEMLKTSALVVLVVLSSLIFVAPGLAQNAVWRIDSEHSTARLFLASSTNPDDAVNVGVARANGLVTRNADDSAAPDFDFTIYPADKTASLERFQQEQNNEKPGNEPDYTVISFKSTRVVRVDKETFRVTGNLTLTYVERLATYDANEGYSGPVYGPAVNHFLKQEAVFEFHRVNPFGGRAAKEGNAEWSALSTISSERFPELLNAVSATDWPTFVADEHCVMPSTIGEDFGPTCTGESVESAPRKDLHCEMPATIGEDFAGEVCSQTSFPMVITDPAEIDWEAHHHKNGEPKELVANEVQIQLDLKLTKMNTTVADTSGK